jgi:hypothetical protein
MGSGPSDLSAMIEQIVELDGHGIAARDLKTRPSERVFDRVSSSAAGHTQELTLEQLKPSAVLAWSARPGRLLGTFPNRPINVRRPLAWSRA